MGSSLWGRGQPHGVCWRGLSRATVTEQRKTYKPETEPHWRILQKEAAIWEGNKLRKACKRERCQYPLTSGFTFAGENPSGLCLGYTSTLNQLLHWLVFVLFCFINLT